MGNVDHDWETTFLKTIVDKKWKLTMHEEMDSILRNQIWQLIKLPLGKRSITTKWIYKIKNNPTRKPSKYKARLIV
jgi:hypothetical protein